MKVNENQRNQRKQRGPSKVKEKVGEQVWGTHHHRMQRHALDEVNMNGTSTCSAY
jgi:hypothetical protein